MLSPTDTNGLPNGEYKDMNVGFIIFRAIPMVGYLLFLRRYFWRSESAEA